MYGKHNAPVCTSRLKQLWRNEKPRFLRCYRLSWSRKERNPLSCQASGFRLVKFSCNNFFNISYLSEKRLLFFLFRARWTLISSKAPPKLSEERQKRQWFTEETRALVAYKCLYSAESASDDWPTARKYLMDYNYQYPNFCFLAFNATWDSTCTQTPTFWKLYIAPLIFIFCSVLGQSEMAHTIVLQTTLTAFSITK